MRWLALISILCGCGDDGGGGPVTCVMTAELEVRTPAGDYAPVGGRPDADLVTGFQGFQMMIVRVRMSRQPAAVRGYVLVAPALASTFSQSFAELKTSDDPRGGLVSDPFPLFFNQGTLQDLAGHPCKLTMSIGTATCGASSDGTVALVHRANCLSSADGGLQCGDGGT